ncbi:hypothetical protein DFH28DRAFT_891295 [Melampsora americana]|nr:hypothetical protein DFH28DRAFT_891295 [Melampsora americana]
MSCFIILICALCLNVIALSWLDHLFEDPEPLHISGGSGNFENPTFNPITFSDKSFEHIPNLNHRLETIEKEFIACLEAPEIMSKPGSEFETFHHTDLDFLLPEKSHETLTKLEWPELDHKHTTQRFNTLGGYEAPSGNDDHIHDDHTSEKQDTERHFIPVQSMTKTEATNQKDSGSSDKSFRTLKAQKFNPKKRKKEFEDEEILKSNLYLKDQIDIDTYVIRPKRYRVDERMLSRELQWEGQLAMWNVPDHSEKIKSDFKTFEDYVKSISILKSNWDRNFNPEKLLFLTKKLKSELAVVFLGVLKVLFHGKSDIPSMELLIEDSWDFLYKYLKEEFQILQPETCFSPSLIRVDQYLKDKVPGEILSHTISLPKRSPIPTKIIFQLLERWSRSSKYHETISKISFDYSSFINKCDEIYKQRGEEKMGKLGAKNRSFCSEMKRRADDLFRREQSKVGKEVKEFFEVLKKKTKESYIQNHLQSSKFNLHQVNQNLKLIDTAVSIADKFIAPTFMGFLTFLHQDMVMDETWDLIIQSGWDLLKAYFGRWSSFFSKTKDTIGLGTTSRSKLEETDWSDVIETINNLGLRNPRTMISPQISWFLLDLWYDHIITSKQNEIQKISKKVLKPNRQDLMMKYQESLS